MKKVLIVDDHRGAATALSVALRFDGRLQPLGPARTVESALGLAADADIVVLDLNLVDSAGAETVERFKAGAPAGLPVVVYSAADEEAKGMAEANVSKGNVQDLIQVLAQLLGLEAQ